MSWTLETPDGTSLQVNAWNWRPTLELLENSGVLDEETADLLGYNIAVDLTADQAHRIATFLDTYLASLPDEARVMLDGSTTTEPDTNEFHRDDLSLNYSASTDWLRRFRDFCHTARTGFTAS
ncbi:hypothetical protein ABZW11_02305 [Nonomuraea sp. NPDC004580]|uniref:hypothetical protein n=1 Tax=Nonomuraea sp. NPDC004580 TaxID=3154552 RepID=UPI0033A7CA77